MKLLFLDVDGVLNSHKFFKANPRSRCGTVEQIDQKKVTLLKKIVKDDTTIVLSSSWRRGDLINEVKNALKKQGIAFTWTTPDLQTFRGVEIAEFISKIILFSKPEPVTSFVILDDDDDMLPWQKPFFIQTSMEDGLTQKHVIEARKILEEKWKGDES